MTGSNVMRFFTGNSEGARLDASRNWLVGKTNTTFSTSGVELRAGNSGSRFIRRTQNRS